MRPLRFALLLLVVLGAAQTMLAAPCVAAPLSVYDGLGFTCTFGPFTLTDFAFSLVLSSGGPITITDASVLVTPVTSPLRYGLDFSSAGWTVSSGQTAVYLLAYTWDPGPVRSLEEVMNDPPVPPGSSTILTDICIGAAFVGATCSGTPASVTVSDPGLMSNSVSFTPPISGIIGIRHTITLDASTGGSADITNFTSTVVIPEPGTFAGGLFALALAARKLRLKRF
jgi:hypothetical protein